MQKEMMARVCHQDLKNPKLRIEFRYGITDNYFIFYQYYGICQGVVRDGDMVHCERIPAAGTIPGFERWLHMTLAIW